MHIGRERRRAFLMPEQSEKMELMQRVNIALGLVTMT